jgi:hypothetical protein
MLLFVDQYSAYLKDVENLKNVHVEFHSDDIICFEACGTRWNDLAYKAKV